MFGQYNFPFGRSFCRLDWHLSDSSSIYQKLEKHMKKKLQFCTVIKFRIYSVHIWSHLRFSKIFRPAVINLNRKLSITAMFANINECISLNCITPTSSGSTRAASAFCCCLTIICCWANLENNFQISLVKLSKNFYLVSTLNVNWVRISVKVKWFKSKS